MCDFVSSLYTSNMLYLHYHNDYGFQTWQGGSIQWRAFFNKIKKSLDHGVLQDHVTSDIRYIFITKRPLAIELGKVVSYYGTSTYKVKQPFKTRVILRSRYKWKTFYLLYHNAWSHQCYQGNDLGWVALNHKVTWSFKQVVVWGNVTN